jgi:hypothetical protein
MGGCVYYFPPGSLLFTHELMAHSSADDQTVAAGAGGNNFII